LPIVLGGERNAHARNILSEASAVKFAEPHARMAPIGEG